MRVTYIQKCIAMLLCSILTLMAVPTVKVEASDAEEFCTVYDINMNGEIDVTDVEFIKDSVLNNTNYHVCDYVRAFRISQNTYSPSPTHITQKVSDLEVCESNYWFFQNTFMSDFEMVIHEDQSHIYFDLIENGVVYYTTEWDKEYVVYNLDSTDRIVQTEYDDCTYEVLVRNNHYYLNVIDVLRMAPPIVLYDYSEAKISYEHVKNITNLLGNKYKLLSVTEEDSYVEFFFAENNDSFDYIIRVPYIDQPTDTEENVETLGSAYFKGHNYVFISKQIDGSFSVQVKVS